MLIQTQPPTQLFHLKHHHQTTHQTPTTGDRQALKVNVWLVWRWPLKFAARLVPHWAIGSPRTVLFWHERQDECIGKKHFCIRNFCLQVIVMLGSLEGRNHRKMHGIRRKQMLLISRKEWKQGLPLQLDCERGAGWPPTDHPLDPWWKVSCPGIWYHSMPQWSNTKRILLCHDCWRTEAEIVDGMSQEPSQDIFMALGTHHYGEDTGNGNGVCTANKIELWQIVWGFRGSRHTPCFHAGHAAAPPSKEVTRLDKCSVWACHFLFRNRPRNDLLTPQITEQSRIPQISKNGFRSNPAAKTVTFWSKRI